MAIVSWHSAFRQSSGHVPWPVTVACPVLGSRAMRFEGAPETVKMACGENPKRVYVDRSQSPSTRTGNIGDLREASLAPQRYEAPWKAREEQASSDQDPGGKPPPERDLDMETLVGVLEGESLPHIHCLNQGGGDPISTPGIDRRVGLK